MSTVRKSYSQWAGALKQEIFATVKAVRPVFAHKAKLLSLNNEFNNFYRAFLKMPMTNEPVPEETDKTFNDIIQTIKSLKELYDNLTEKTFLKFVTTNPVDIVNKKIDEFRDIFNNQAITLKIAKEAPISNHNKSSLEKQDCIQLIRALEPYSTQMAVQNLLQQLKKRVEKADNNLLFSENEQKTSKDNDNDAESDAQPKEPKLTDNEFADFLKDFSKFVINSRNFQYKKKLTTKATYSIYQGFMEITGTPITVKEFSSKGFTKKEAEDFKREVSILTKLKHFTIPKFIGITITQPYSIISEDLPGESLFQRLHAAKAPLSSTQLTIVALGSAYSFAYLHSENIIYRNIKSTNIALDSYDLPHIREFGTATFVSESNENPGFFGTKQWMAPEVLEGGCYTMKSDVYSFGMVLYELLTNNVPFPDMKDTEIVDAVQKGKRPPIPTECSSQLSSLINRCWDKNPEKRPTFAAIIHDFESGDVCFGDANIDLVQAYKEKYSGTVDQQINKFDFNSVSKEKFTDILASIALDDEKKQLKAIGIMLGILSQSEWTDVIVKSDIVEKIQKIMEACKYPKVAYDLIRLTDLMLSISPIASSLNEKGSTFTKHILNIMQRFGEKQNFNEFLSALYITTIKEKEKPIFTERQMHYIGSYFSSKNKEIQNKTFNLYDFILKNKLYDSIDALAAPITTMLNSYVTKVQNEKIAASLVNLTKIDKLIIAEMNKTDAPTIIFPMCFNKNLAKDAMTILLSICSAQTPSQIFSQQLITNFAKVVDAFNEEPIRPLLLLSTVLLVQTTYIKMSETQSAIKCIDNYLKSKNNQILVVTLKLCFIFFENEISSKAMVSVVPSVENLLNSENQDIHILAASILILAISHAPSTYANDQEICNYIKKSLSGDAKEKIIGSKLIGVLGPTKEGAKLIQQNGSISQLCSLILSSDRTIRYYALAALTVLSSSLNYTSEMNPIIEVFINLPLEDMAYQFIHSFVSNIVANKEGATIAAKYIQKLVENSLISNQKSTIVYLAAIQKIVEYKETTETVQQKEILESLVKLLPLVSKGFGTYIFSIYNAVIELPGAKEIIGTEEVIRTAKTAKESYTEDCQQKRVLTHIIEVLSK